MSLERALFLCGIREGEHFSIAAIADRHILATCFTSSKEAAAWLAMDQFRGWGHYFCGNPVRPECTGKPKADDVTEGRILLVDVDPADGADGTEARAAVLRFAGWLDATVHQYPTVVDSGRGTQAWVRVDRLDAGQRRRFAKGVAERFACDGAKFDATFNVDRLMRVPSSVNQKTGRVAAIVHEGTGPPITPAMLEQLGLPELADLAPAGVPFDFGKASEADLALVTGEARRVWDSPTEKGERSVRDFKLVLALVRQGVPEATACRLLWAMPGSKAATDRRGEDYWRSTLESVRRHLAEEDRKRARAHALPDAAEDDVGAPLEPDALDALLFVREHDGDAEWVRLRDRLKKAKVPLRALEDAMARRKRTAQGCRFTALRYVADDRRRVGWFAHTVDRGWVPVDGSEARATMRAQGLDSDAEVKGAVDAPWALVNEPFADEELDGRRWNKDGARLAFVPAEGKHPTWDMVLGNLGRGIDAAVAEDAWCKAGGVRDGAGYLLAWVASLVQRPKERTAYLFFYGEQDAGKSLFHEALRHLFTRGYASANYAITSKEGFNGEIANAVLCAVEEVDLSDQRRQAHQRVKSWVTGKTITVRALYYQAYDLDNATHWVQCANKLSYMPVLPNDTRITAIPVSRVPDEERVPKELLLERLVAEAPAFLWTVTTLPLPAATGRLRVPALETRDKSDQAAASRSELEEWLDRSAWLELSDGELVGAFLESLPPGARSTWDRARVSRELPPEARRDRRLVAALRCLPLGATTSGVHATLPPDVRRDWPNAIGFGRVLTRLADKVGWLERVTVRGMDEWRRS